MEYIFLQREISSQKLKSQQGKQDLNKDQGYFVTLKFKKQLKIFFSKGETVPRS